MFPKANASFVTHFPLEISAYIFSLLPQQDRIQCMDVCQLWRQGVIYGCQAWRTTELYLFDIDDMIDWLNHVSPIIRHLHIDSQFGSLDPDDIEKAACGDLDVEDQMLDKQDMRMAKAIPSHLNKLVSLRFDRLESIHYSTDGINGDILQSLIQLAGSKVRLLNIQAIYRFDIEKKSPCVVSILDQCPQLETLIDLEPLCDMVVNDKTSLTPSRIENLELERRQMVPSDIKLLLSKCACLRRIRLCSWSFIKMSPMLLLEQCPRLEIMIWSDASLASLSFYRPEWWRRRTHYDWDDTKLLAQPSSGLRHLVLDVIDGHACISNIMHLHHPTLTRLSISIYTNKVPSQEMTWFPMLLERLDIHVYQDAQQAIENILRPLVEHCHRLKSISIRTDFRDDDDDADPLVLPRWFFVALTSLRDLQHLVIQVDNDPNDMLQFLEAVPVALESLYYHGDLIMPCIDAISNITTLQSLALATSPEECVNMTPIIKKLQQLPRLESLALKHGKGFNKVGVFQCLAQFPCLRQLFIAIHDQFNVQGIRYLTHRQPALETMVLLDLTWNCKRELTFGHLEKALYDARGKIANVQGGRVCAHCDDHARRYDM